MALARPGTGQRRTGFRSIGREPAASRYSPDMPIDPPDDIVIELVESTADGDQRTEPTAQSPRSTLEFAFAGELWDWRGPAPYHFITVPPGAARAIHAIAAAEVRIGDSTWSTALWPKDGGYVIPIKDRYRTAERLVLGDVADVQLVVRR